MLIKTSLICIVGILLAVLLLLFNPFGFIENVFLQIEPVVWAALGIAACCGLSILGAALGMYITGSSLMGAAIRRPDMKTKHLVTILFCEAVAIYGIVFSIILSVLFNGRPKASMNTVENYHAGYGMFWAGLTVGVVNLAGGVCVGTIGSSAAVIDAQNPSLFIRLIILEVLASAVGLFGLISGFIQASNITQLV